MSSLSSITTEKIYRSRNFLLEQLKNQGYNVDDYANFSINEIDVMYKQNQMDMLLERESDQRKIYVKYHLTSGKSIRNESLGYLIKDLFEIESVLQKTDTLYIVQNEKPNDTLLKHLEYLYKADGIFVVVNTLAQLQFNCLKHQYNPSSIRILSDEETNALKQKYGITHLSQFPEVSRFDPVAVAICLRPGQICEYDRKSIVAMSSLYYRACV